ncbi:MAG: hypothetical protein AAF196_04885 [Planctomycetota bacterium]
MTSSRSDFLWTLCGRLGFTGANGAMMLGLYLSDPEGFPLARFGSLLVFIQAQLLLSRLLLAGQDQAVVRFWPEHRRQAIRNSMFWVRTCSLVAIGLGLVAEIGISQLGLSIPRGTAMMVAVGASAQAYLDMSAATLMATLRFKAAGLLLSIGPLIRAGAVLLVAAERTEFAYTIGTVLIALGAVQVSALASRSATRQEGTDDSSFALDRLSTLRYGAWIAVADALVILSLSSAVFAVKFQGQEFANEGSRLAFAMAVAQGHFAVFLAFYQSLLPRASHCQDLAEFDRVFESGRRSSVKLAIGLVVLSGLAIAVLIPLVTRFRPEGLGFHWPLLVLTAFMVALVFEAPYGVTAQYLKRPRLQVQALAVRASIACTLAFGLSFAGAIPAVIGQAIGAFAGLSALVLFVNRAQRRHRSEEVTPCAASQA